MDPHDRDQMLVCLHSTVHQLLEQVEELSRRTASIQEISSQLRCPSCGHSPMIVERLVDEKVGE